MHKLNYFFYLSRHGKFSVTRIINYLVIVFTTIFNNKTKKNLKESFNSKLKKSL